MNFTEHARRRMKEMGLSPTDVIHVVEHAEVDYVQPRYQGQRLAKCGGISVAYEPDERLVITVLYNTQAEYGRP